MTKRSTVKKNKKNYNSYHKTSEAYDYSYAVPKPKEDKKPKIKKKKKRGTPKLKIKYVYSNKNNGKISMSTYGTIFVFFICAVFWVFSYSMVNIQRAVNENLRKELESEFLRVFLARHKAKFKGGKLDESALQRLALPFEQIKTSAGVEFSHFVLYDISFKNASGGAFIGVLLALKNAKFKANLPSLDENALFERLSHTDFDTQRLFVKGEFALIASLKNPFFISPKLNLEQNLAQMNANLAQIQALIA